MSAAVPQSLYLLDGMPLCYRAHFALSRHPITTSSGFNTSAIYVYTNTLLEIIKQKAPTHIVVAFDSEAPTHRHRDYPAYKAQREAMPEALSAALPYIFRITEAFRIPILKCEGYEADDIMGTLAKQAEKVKMPTYLVTPDKDFSQLVSDSIWLYKPGRMGEGHSLVGMAEIQQHYSLKRPEQFVDLIGLWGDASDNIPGVPGIGEKTAIQLIYRYETLENLLEHTHELKGKQRENLEHYADQARLSKQLATIVTDVPLATVLDELAYQAPDKKALERVFAELEFDTLAKRVLGTAKGSRLGAAEAEPAMETALPAQPSSPGDKTLATVPHDYQIVDSPQAQARLVEQLKQHNAVCFDTETTSLDAREAELVGLAFSVTSHKGFYVPVRPGNVSATLERFRPVFEDPAIEKIGHNLKFDLNVLYTQGITVKGELFDTFLAHSLVEPGQRHSLDRLSEQYLHYRPIPITDLIGDKDDALSMREVPVTTLASYAAEDADVTLQLKPIMAAALKRTCQEKVFYTVECPLIPVLVQMEADGMALNVTALKAYVQQLTQQIDQLADEIQEQAGTSFNLNSPKQLGQVLFDLLKLDPKAKRTKTGRYATSEAVLGRLAPRHEIVEKILRHRGLTKLKSTYGEALVHHISPQTGRIHTHYSQLNTVTGRLQSSHPNLQNIPIRTEEGREIRRAFVARGDGYSLLSADYSQIELRILAVLSEDAAMSEAFHKGVDIHRATAAKIYDVPAEAVIPEMRRTAKMVNFGIPYGISAFGLAQRLSISRIEAAALIKAYFEQFPGIARYIEKTLTSAREQGYVTTVTGRRRYLPEIGSANAAVRSGAQRNAINMPIQGTAADMIKLAMIRIHERLTAGSFRTRLLLQVHDELVFELYDAEKQAVLPLVEEAMKTALPLTVPLVIEMGIGKDWLQAH